METKTFLTLAVILMSSIMLFTGCGKSDKEVKTGSNEKVAGKTAGSTTLKVNTNESIVEWLGKKVTGQHHGTIKISKGELNVEKDKVVAGYIEIDMNTIVDIDLKDSTDNKKLTGHLKSDDFFVASKFPTAKFEISGVSSLNDPNKPSFNSMVKGNLTIKGMTKGIEFPATIKIENGILKADADFDIDRTQWDIRYGSGKFFEGLGDKMISDNFNIRFRISAN